MDNNPIHVVGPVNLSAARADALRAFHLDLDKADENLRNLLGKKAPTTTSGRPALEFIISDESAALARDAPASLGLPHPMPFPRIGLVPPWFVDVDEGAGQPA